LGVQSLSINILLLAFLLEFVPTQRSVGNVTAQEVAGDEFTRSKRDEWQLPNRVMAALDLKQGIHIADVGCGPGYFVPYLSRAAGQGGRVFAVDIQSRMLSLVERQAARLDLDNVDTVLSKETDTRLEPRSVDLAVMVNVYYELGAPEALLENLSKVLETEGQLAIIDYRVDKNAESVGPPLSHRVAQERVIAEAERAGFRLLKTHDFLPYQYFLLFELVSTGGEGL